MVILVGAGGNAIDVLSFMSLEKPICFIDDAKIGTFQGIKIIGTINDLISMKMDNLVVYNCIGSIGYNRTRNVVYEKLKLAGIKTSPIVMTNMISNNVKTGDNCSVGTGAQLHHDVVLDESCFVCPGAIICGNVHLKKNCFVGAGAIITQDVTIGENSVVGAGTVVLHDIPDNQVWVGNPARYLKEAH